GSFGVRAGEAVLSSRMAALKAKGINSIQELVDEAMLNPERARELLSKTYTTRIRPGIRAPFQAGGAVPATGGKGGRSSGAAAPAAARAPRQGASKCLHGGGGTRHKQAD